MAIVCPTVTAFDPHQYREQMELLQPFAERIHIDLMDGVFAPTTSPPLANVWWPEHITADLHLMYQKPERHIEMLTKLKPHLVVIQAEAEVDHAAFAGRLHAAGIKAGLALLQPTSVASVSKLLEHFDHVMIFSGNLGRHGGSKVDFDLLSKVREIREQYADIEIAWDGGVNLDNIKQLAAAGVDAFGVGGFIHNAEDPAAAYRRLMEAVASA